MGEGADNLARQKPDYRKIILQTVAIVLIALLIVFFMRKYASDISSLQYLSILDILMIGGWSLVSYTAYAYAVYIVLVAVGLKGLGPLGWFKVYFVSRLANLFVTQGGNVFRLLVLKKKYNFSYTNSIGVTAFLVWINAVIALFASVSFLLGAGELAVVPGVSLLRWSVFMLLALWIGPPVLAWTILRRPASSIWQSGMLRPFADIASFFLATLKNRVLFSRLTILSIVHFIFFVGVNYWTFRAIDQSVEIAAVCIFTTAFVFTRYVNVVPGNIGVSELIGGLVSEQMGIGFGNGLLVSGIVRVVEVIMVLLIGLLYGKFLAFSYFRE